jgi:iron-sulfur cluster repair protein YtfE (RIC family)
MMNPFFDLLHQEHELVATIIKDIEYTPPERSTELEDRWTALKRALLPHIVAEENTYYPVIQSRRNHGTTPCGALKSITPSKPSFLKSTTCR